MEAAGTGRTRIPGPAGRIALLAALLAVSGCSESDAPTVTPSREEAVYVGATVCGTCHHQIQRSFARSGMGRSFYPMTAESAVESFDETIEIADQGLFYTISQEDGRYYQRQFQLDRDGREINSDRREMIYVLGSGNHSRSYVTVHDGRLYQLPICWYPTPGLWDLCPGYEMKNEYFQRPIDDTCLFCHNGRVEGTGGFSNSFRDPIPHGIGCERCHGPGSIHVDRWMAATEDEPYQESDAADPTILNPARLAPSRSVQVCMQCHLGDSGQTERIIRTGRDMDDYRPWLPLHRFTSVQVYSRKLRGRFGLTAQAERMALSRCYTESEDFQCITCHNPHEEVYEVSASRPDHFNSRCMECHDCAIAEQRSGDCVACHMRRAEPTDQRHTTFIDHWIRRFPSEGIEEERTDFAMEPFFPPDVTGETAWERAFNLGRAYYLKKLNTPEGRAMPWDLARGALNRAAELAPDRPGIDFFLGKLAVSRGNWPEAEKHFRRSLTLDPDHVEAMQELGSVLLALGRTGEARAALESALEMGPRTDDREAVLNELARIEMQEGHHEAAAERIEAALELEPFAPEIHANSGILRALEGDQAGALGAFEEALRHAPNHPEIHRLLAEELMREGPRRDLDRAVHAATRAVELAPGDRRARRTLNAACAAAGKDVCGDVVPASAGD